MSSSCGHVSVGTPPAGHQEWETLEFRLHGFESMPKNHNHAITTPERTCFGHRWALMVYPGGESGAKDGMVSIFLKRCSKKCGIKFQFAVSIKASNGVSAVTNGIRSDTYDFPGENWGWPDFILRSSALEALVDGSLVVEVCMKPKEPGLLPFIPKNPFCNAMKKMFLDKKYADVVFEVVESKGHEKDSDKDPPSVSFHAHRMILEECAPALAEICEASEDLSPIPINDVGRDIFHHLLSYVYGWTIPAEELETHAKEFIDSADIYGVVNLKLEAEAIYAATTEITIENVIDILLHADAKNCALMKEVALEFIAENGTEVLSSVDFDDVPGHLFKDLLVTTTRRETKDSKTTDDKGSIMTMRVNELRRKLHAKGLPIDGSRETMIAALSKGLDP